MKKVLFIILRLLAVIAVPFTIWGFGLLMQFIYGLFNFHVSIIPAILLSGPFFIASAFALVVSYWVIKLIINYIIGIFYWIKDG